MSLKIGWDGKMIADIGFMRTYTIEIKNSGMTVRFVTVKAPGALMAIDHVIGSLEVPYCNEYIARRIT